MRNSWWFLAPLFWILAVLPLMAAFWVYLELPETIQVTPEHTMPTGRVGVWPLPIVNLLFAVALHIAAGRIERHLEHHFRTLGRTSDAPVVIPGVKLFMMAHLSAICLSVVYAHYVMDTGRLALSLMGRVSAFVPGIGVALFAMRLPHASKDSLLALRFPYTEKSSQVWLKTHKLGSRVLYAAGAVMVITAFVSDGITAVVTAALALSVSLFVLYLYAKRLYDDEPYR